MEKTLLVTCLYNERAQVWKLLRGKRNFTSKVSFLSRALRARLPLKKQELIKLGRSAKTLTISPRFGEKRKREGKSGFY